MKLDKDCAQHIAAVVFGCTGLAFGGTVAAAAVAPAVGVATLLAIAKNALTKAKPDDAKQIKKLIGKLADAADDKLKTQPHERGKILRATEQALLIYLPQIDISHATLGQDAFEEGGFPVAATRRVLAVLIELELQAGVEPEKRLFCAEHGKSDAIALTEDIFNATFEQALTNEDYFKSLKPHLIVLNAKIVGKIDRTQDEQGETLKQQSDDLASIKATLAKMQAAQSIPPSLSEAQVLSILISFGHQDIPQERWEIALLESAAKLKDLETQLAEFRNEAPEIAALLSQAQAAIDRAEFDKAEAHLAEAEQRDIEAGELRIRRAASSREKRAELAAAQGRHIEAADHYAEAAKLVRGFDAMEWARLKFEEGLAAYERGQYHPEPDITRRAITAYRAALEEQLQARVPLHWAATQNNLGNAFLTLGERGDDDALRDAITAYHAALEEQTQACVPLDWAMTQNNLGSALSMLSQRGDEGALQGAITAYRAALEEQTQVRVPLDWAMTQNNLGNALSILNRRGDEGALQGAITAYRAALKVRTQVRAPLQWAATQNNLGVALLTLGQRGDDVALQDAIMAYRAALEERTQGRVPLDWAGTQYNFGNALLTLGQRGDGVALQDAITAYREALEERTQDRVPLDWAMTQNNLGSAYETWGDQSGERAHWEQAVEYYQAALSVFEGRAPAYEETVRSNMGRVRSKLSE